MTFTFTSGTAIRAAAVAAGQASVSRSNTQTITMTDDTAGTFAPGTFVIGVSASAPTVLSDLTHTQTVASDGLGPGNWNVQVSPSPSISRLTFTQSGLDFSTASAGNHLWAAYFAKLGPISSDAPDAVFDLGLLAA